MYIYVCIYIFVNIYVHIHVYTQIYNTEDIVNLFIVWHSIYANRAIQSECGVMRARPTPNANTFHAVDVKTLLRCFNTIVL